MKSIKEKTNKSQNPTLTAIDLVCGMEIDQARCKHRIEHNEEVYYFCNISCKNHFVMDPGKYTGN